MNIKSAECVFCGLAAVGGTLPPACVRCAQLPYSHPEVLHAFWERQGLAGAVDPDLASYPVIPGEEIDEEYHGLFRAVVGFAVQVVTTPRIRTNPLRMNLNFEGSVTDLKRIVAFTPADDLRGDVQVEQIALSPWREVAYTPGSPVWVEVQFRLLQEDYRTHIHYSGGVELSTEDELLVKRMRAMLDAPRVTGNPGHDATKRAEIARLTREARRLKGEGWNSSQIGKQLKVPPGTVRAWLSKHRDKSVG